MDGWCKVNLLVGKCVVFVSGKLVAEVICELRGLAGTNTHKYQ